MQINFAAKNIKYYIITARRNKRFLLWKYLLRPNFFYENSTTQDCQVILQQGKYVFRSVWEFGRLVRQANSYFRV